MLWLKNPGLDRCQANLRNEMDAAVAGKDPSMWGGREMRNMLVRGRSHRNFSTLQRISDFLLFTTGSHGEMNKMLCSDSGIRKITPRMVGS